MAVYFAGISVFFNLIFNYVSFKNNLLQHSDKTGVFAQKTLDES